MQIFCFGVYFKSFVNYISDFGCSRSTRQLADAAEGDEVTFHACYDMFNDSTFITGVEWETKA